jgi:exopolyphosphatase/guanosine-5'-triphosphate,3'-diphosphate pyrophosphatase
LENIVTAIDLGSNSMRMLMVDKESLKTIGEFEKTVGTADGIGETCNITIEAQTRIINALKEGIEKLQFDPQKAVAVTTQAMRIAKNQKEVLENIKINTGVNFQVIDGEKEASLTLLAIRYALKRHKFPSDKFIALDIGGGSTELIIVDKKTRVKSFPYGIVVLAQSQNRKVGLKALKNEMENYLQEDDIDLEEYSFVATAGTPTTIAAMMHNQTFATYNKHIINGTNVSMNDMIDVQNYLNSLHPKELEIKVGNGRTHYVDTGIEIFKLVYQILNKKSSIVFDDGLREGVAIQTALKGTI